MSNDSSSFDGQVVEQTPNDQVVSLGRELVARGSGGTAFAALIALFPDSTARTVALIMVPALMAVASFIWSKSQFYVAYWIDDLLDTMLYKKTRGRAVRVLNDPRSSEKSKREAQKQLDELDKLFREDGAGVFRQRMRVRLDRSSPEGKTIRSGSAVKTSSHLKGD